MKIKLLASLISFLLLLAFVGCNDEMNNIGANIQPPKDSIYVLADTISLKAKTIPVDGVYARTINGVLGKYEDDIFGSIKSDYLCQFYYSDSTKFKNNVISIDSTKFAIDYALFSGDTLAPMGLSVYQVIKPLVDDFYTNVDPTPYIGSNPKLITNSAYTINGSPIVAPFTTGYPQRTISSLINNDYGQKIYEAYKSGLIKDKDSFNKAFPGMYVTTTFGSGVLINIIYTSVDIYYKWNDIKGNHDHTQDTIRNTVLTLSVTPEVIQLNHVKNENPEELFQEGTGQTYLKTPAGVFTEIVFPIKQIVANMKLDGKEFYNTVTSAQFSLKGYTEKEPSKPFSLERPEYLLLIDKDSVNTFFTNRKLPDGKTSVYTTRNTTYNTYNFFNISSIMNNYIAKNVDSVTFLAIPVEVISEKNVAVGVYNYLKPSTSILRSDPSNMRMELIYSRFNNNN